MGRVVFGGRLAKTKRIDEETFKKIAQYLGIPKAEVDQLMAENPRAIYIYRAPDAASNPSDPVVGGSGGSSGA